MTKQIIDFDKDIGTAFAAIAKYCPVAIGRDKSVELFCIKLGRKATDQEVYDEAERQGVRMATFAELLNYAVENPDVGSENNIVMTVIPLGERDHGIRVSAHAHVEEDGKDGRVIRFGESVENSNRWSTRWSFLVARK